MIVAVLGVTIAAALAGFVVGFCVVWNARNPKN